VTGTGGEAADHSHHRVNARLIAHLEISKRFCRRLGGAHRKALNMPPEHVMRQRTSSRVVANPFPYKIRKSPSFRVVNLIALPW